jgi:hypothetical protein
MMLILINGGVNKHRLLLDNQVYGDSLYLRTLASNTAGKLDVLRHDSHTLGVNGSKIGILEKTNKVSLCGFLKS